MDLITRKAIDMIKFKKFSKGLDNVTDESFLGVDIDSKLRTEFSTDNYTDVDVLIKELDQRIEMEPEVTVEELVIRNQEELEKNPKELDNNTKELDIVQKDELNIVQKDELDIVQKDEIEASKFLTGSPELFIFSSDVTKRMIRHGLASDMGDGKLARGFLWSVYN